MPLVNFQISTDDHAEFLSTCKRLRYTQSEVLRTLVKAFTSRNREVKPEPFVTPDAKVSQVQDIHIDDLLGGE